MNGEENSKLDILLQRTAVHDEKLDTLKESFGEMREEHKTGCAKVKQVEQEMAEHKAAHAALGKKLWGLLLLVLVPLGKLIPEAIKRLMGS